MNWLNGCALMWYGYGFEQIKLSFCQISFWYEFEGVEEP